MKRFLSIFLVVTLVLSTSVMQADAKERLTDYSCIDYSRLHCDHRDVTMKGELNLGGYSIPCEFTIGNNLPRYDANQIIMQVLDETGLTEDQIRQLSAKVKKAAKYYSVSSDDLFGAIGGDAWNVYDMSSGKYGEYAAAAMDGDMTHIGDLASLVLGASAGIITLPETFMGFVIGALISAGCTAAGKILQDAVDNGSDMIIKDAIQSTRVLNAFYDEINRRIDKADGTLTRQIVFDGASVAYENQELFGIGGNTLWLRVKGTLEGGEVKKIPNLSKLEKTAYFSGEYQGALTFDISYDAKGFDSGFLEKIFMETPIAKTTSSVCSFTDAYNPSIIKKVLYAPEVCFKIDAGYRMNAKPIQSAYLKSSRNCQETDIFVIDHTVRSERNKIGMVDGHYENNLGPAHVTMDRYSDVHFNGELKQGLYAHLRLDEVMNNYSAEITTPWTSNSFGDPTETKGSVDIMHDYELYDFLRKRPVLYFNRASYKEINDIGGRL